MSIKKRRRRKRTAYDIHHNAQRRISRKKAFKKKLYLFLLDATRNRKKRIAIYIVMALLVLLLIWAVLGVKSVISSLLGGSKSDTKAEQTTEESVKDDTTQEVDIKALIKEVRAQVKEEGVPDDIVEMLDKNDETVYFVRDYMKKKDQKVATTLGDDFVAGEIPQILQWDERWGYKTYGNAHIGSAGCGPTVLSMVLSGLTEDATITPAVIADYSEKNNFIDENDSTYWAIMENVSEEYGVTCEEFPAKKKNIKEELKKGNPVICSVGEGDFTTQGHFLVLVGEKDGKIQIHDPNSQVNSDKLWKYDRVVKQIKATWRFYIK